jgi:hypothetical protein
VSTEDSSDREEDNTLPGSSPLWAACPRDSLRFCIEPEPASGNNGRVFDDGIFIAAALEYCKVMRRQLPGQSALLG